MLTRMLLATLATSTLAVADSGFLYTSGGTLNRVDGSATTPLFTCQRRAQIIHTPETVEPCRIEALVVHPATGRYAVTIEAPVNRAERRDGRVEVFSYTRTIELAGKEHVPPRDRAGERLSGSYLVLGEASARVAPQVLEGLPSTWRSDSRYLPQAPLAFSTDGQGLLVTEHVGVERVRLWTLDLRGAPRWRLELGGRIYRRITLATGARAIELHTAPGVVAFLDLPGSVTKPLLMPTAQRLPGQLAVARVGGTVVSFREGDCDASTPGEYLRTERTGASRTWRRSTGGCSTSDTVRAVSEARGSVFVEERAPNQGTFILEYVAGEDRARELRLEPSTLRAVTPDGRAMAVIANGGLEIRSLDDGSTWWHGPLPPSLQPWQVVVAFTDFE